MDKIAKIIRVLTVAPVMALVLLSMAYGIQPQSFGSLRNYVLLVVFLVVMPLLGYPLQPVIPGFRDKGREGQRNLAMAMAVLGYVCGTVYAVVFQAPALVWLIQLTYLISGIGVVVLNKLLKVRASGHACGVAGPVAIGCLLAGGGAASGKAALAGGCVLLLTYWASLRTKRHTAGQLAWGTAIPIVSLGLAWLISYGVAG